jgi:hypothetical protein
MFRFLLGGFIYRRALFCLIMRLGAALMLVFFVQSASNGQQGVLNVCAKGGNYNLRAPFVSILVDTSGDLTVADIMKPKRRAPPSAKSAGRTSTPG